MGIITLYVCCEDRKRDLQGLWITGNVELELSKYMWVTNMVTIGGDQQRGGGGGGGGELGR